MNGANEGALLLVLALLLVPYVFSVVVCFQKGKPGPGIAGLASSRRVRLMGTSPAVTIGTAAVQLCNRSDVVGRHRGG